MSVAPFQSPSLRAMFLTFSEAEVVKRLAFVSLPSFPCGGCETTRFHNLRSSSCGGCEATRFRNLAAAAAQAVKRPVFTTSAAAADFGRLGVQK